MFEIFENVLSNLLTRLVFHVQKPMNTLNFVDVETTDKILSQYHSNYKKVPSSRLNQLCCRIPHVIVLALTYFQTSIFLSNHSVYLENFELNAVSVCLPLKFPAAGNVLNVNFIGNNSKQVERSRVKNSFLSY